MSVAERIAERISGRIAERRYTFADLERLRENRTERFELIDGEVFVTPASATAHQRVSIRLSSVLLKLMTDAGRGEVFAAPYDVHFSGVDVVQPDIVVVPADRAAIVGDNAIHGVPGLVVEILLPSTRRTDVTRKRALYAHHGVPEYWLVDPEQCVVAIYSRPEEGDYRAAALLNRTDVAKSATIPEIEVDLATVFAGIEES